MTPHRESSGVRSALVAVVGACLLAACATTSADGVAPATTPFPVTVPDVGVLPAPLPALTTTTESVPATTTEDTVADTTTTEPFAADGNRILMLGDSILASTSKRYSNTMCDALVPLGWQVEIEAEVSRPIQFGVEVMRSRKAAGWDAGLVFLGTNYGGDDTEYLKQLNRIVNDFGEVPIVLVTVSEFRDEMREVNQVIEAITEVYPNLSVLDWRDITAERPELLMEDGIHPTTEGREVLAATVAEHLGAAPATPGKCLDSVFRDDSAGTIDGRPAGSSGSSGSKPSTSTTVTPSGGSGGSGGSATTTTTKPTGTTQAGSATTTSGGGQDSSTTTPSSNTPTTSGTATTAASTPPTSASTPPPVSSTATMPTPPPDTTPAGP